MLVFMLGALGDTLVTLPALRGIRECVGAGTIDLLSEDHRDGRTGPMEVLSGEGIVNESLRYPVRKMRGLAEIAMLMRSLRRRRYDGVVSVLPSERPQAALNRDRLFFRICGIHNALGFEDFRPNGRGKVDCRSESETLLRLRRLTKGAEAQEGWARRLLTDEFRLHPSQAELEKARSWLDAKGILGGKGIVGIAPGAKRKSCRWPADRFGSLASAIVQGLGLPIVIVGGAGDASLAEMILERAPGARNATGLFTVRESAALLSHFALFVGNDTGSTHLAASVGTKTVAIFSDRQPEGQWHPLGTSSIVLRERVPCGCCMCDVCPVAGHPCLAQISVARVLNVCEGELALDRHQG